ncbi:hypothetical protein [Curtobacterium sp. MCBD17_023]|uniref:hypothetical protein n=1 Tax=Curtobacterium sp. MCBD17_023 TaxID=2175657 RepID=UPI000D840493|nr:hypothetical protein [Curtobacterium sp. MCBD17_023]PYY49688.1 hypothetical protein DEI84_08545 [Curtobacterium sp. MCBD17_023]
MEPTYYLSSMEDDRFDSAFRCELESRAQLPNGHHALVVNCDPPALGQDLGFPEGVARLLLWSRFEGDDLWAFPTFPQFVQICLPDVVIPPTRMPTSIAWGELYATKADAEVQSMTKRPHTPTPCVDGVDPDF